MPSLDQIIAEAGQQGASDLHIEPGLPLSLRLQGQLCALEHSFSAEETQALAAALLAPEGWAELQQRRSTDLSRVMGGHRCRVNVLHSQRGVGLAIRLLHPFQATLESLNLHPELSRLTARAHGLILVSGPTGSGKSSTIAALVEELNRSRALHVLTLEQPIEHLYRPRRCLIRQREVGRDTPSYQQGLMDALREDPDELVVGELRDPETIRLALTAAETGHLVITTLHAGTCAEALTRMVASFAPEAQAAVSAALAEVLIGVVSQRLYHRPDLGLRLPECEVLMSTDAVRAGIRSGQLSRLQSAIQMGGAEGMWTFERWRRWQESRERHFHRRRDAAREPLAEEAAPALPRPAPPPLAAPEPPRAALPRPPRAIPPRPEPRPPRSAPVGARVAEDGVLELDGDHEDLAAILKELG